MPFMQIVCFIIYLPTNNCLVVRHYHSPIPSLTGTVSSSRRRRAIPLRRFLSAAPPCLSSAPEAKRKFGDSLELEISVSGAFLDLRGTGTASEQHRMIPAKTI
ncbi:hypothetical protein PVAP13_8NG049801 [Panicum virgatum]|uniref:Uncharacterized protein n=1 Tax=Panicum virgatum TaxID=38727 RepID=A0A8T0P2G8_PANVG|nr:hypothetical protein PVAP13_8NG049801 [Panicum virgatum]